MLQRLLESAQYAARRYQRLLDEHGITPATVKKQISDIIAHVSQGDGVQVDLDLEDGANNLVGHNLRGYIEELEGKMRKAAGDLEFETAARLRDEIRRLEQGELGIGDTAPSSAPRIGRSNEGKPGTRKMRYGKTQRKWRK